MNIIYGSYIYDDEIEDIMENINKDIQDYFYADDYFNGSIEANDYINNFFKNNIIRFYPKPQTLNDPDEPLWIMGYKIDIDNNQIDNNKIDKKLKEKIYNDYIEICDYFFIKKSKKLYYFSVKN